MSPDAQPNPERNQTDESLRNEREKADDALGEELTPIEEIADAVINKARARADAVLARARATTDQRSPLDAPPETVQRERKLADQTLDKERAVADATVRVERTNHAITLSVERDETDKDLLTERAKSDSAVATRDVFLGFVSHDLRNMLAVMIGYAGLIASTAGEDNEKENIRMHATRIQRSGARMDRLIGDLVDVASIAAGRLAVTCEVGNPVQVVREAVDTFQPEASSSGVSIATEIIPPSPLVAFDPARILQVLSNLLGNAIKFTPPQGKVIVRVERKEDDLQFCVQDTGAGIPKDKLEAIFEPFVQVGKTDGRRRGVGLGLYISKCIVEGHGGRIWAESKLGVGSTFCFTLPIHRAT